MEGPRRVAACKKEAKEALEFWDPEKFPEFIENGLLVGKHLSAASRVPWESATKSLAPWAVRSEVQIKVEGRGVPRKVDMGELACMASEWQDEV